MDCIIAAGGVPGPDDPLYPYTQGRPKALIPMGDRTMLEHVVDALQSSTGVREIVVVGLGQALADEAGLEFRRPVHHLPDQGSLLANALAGARWLRSRTPELGHFLACSGDIPLLTGAMVDDFLAACQPGEAVFYYNVVTQAVMEARFPHSQRTYVSLTDARVAGGDLFLLHSHLIDRDPELWDALIHARKNALRLARILGLRVLLKLLFRRLSAADLEALGGRLFERPARVIFCPHAELAMDGDKPEQIDLLRAELARLRAAAHGVGAAEE